MAQASLPRSDESALRYTRFRTMPTVAQEGRRRPAVDGGMSDAAFPHEEVLAKGQFGPFRVTWIVGGIGVLCLVASMKFIFVDRAMDVALYPALGALPFGLVAAICWMRSGTFSITKTAVYWQTRTGAPLALAVADIASVQRGQGRLPVPRHLALDGGRGGRLDQRAGPRGDCVPIARCASQVTGVTPSLRFLIQIGAVAGMRRGRTPSPRVAVSNRPPPRVASRRSARSRSQPSVARGAPAPRAS